MSINIAQRGKLLLFDRRALREGDILACRTTTGFGSKIRMILGSYTNHNGIFVMKDGKWYIAEAVKPKSILTPLSAYEKEIFDGTVVRVWRTANQSVTDEERSAVAQYVLDHMLGLPYPINVWRLWIFRLVNSLPWKIEGQWCTRVVWEAWEKIVPGIFNRPDGKTKLNPTPRTFENRLVAGVVKDVTDVVLN